MLPAQLSWIVFLVASHINFLKYKFKVVSLSYKNCIFKNKILKLIFLQKSLKKYLNL